MIGVSNPKTVKLSERKQGELAWITLCDISHPQSLRLRFQSSRGIVRSPDLPGVYHLQILLKEKPYSESVQGLKCMLEAIHDLATQSEICKDRTYKSMIVQHEKYGQLCWIKLNYDKSKYHSDLLSGDTIKETNRERDSQLGRGHLATVYDNKPLPNSPKLCRLIRRLDPRQGRHIRIAVATVSSLEE